MPIRRVSLALGNDAKKPPFARWVGRGGLPTLPFVVCQRGPILLVSICDEIPSVAMTFTALGLQFCYVAVGGPEHLQATTRFLFSHCLVVPELNSFHFSHLPHVWKNAPFWSIVIVGREMPFIASRAIPVSMEVCRLAQEATELRKGLTSPCNVLAMVETCTPEVKAPKMFGPICTEAAHFGHISRPSFWWWFSTPECCAFSSKHCSAQCFVYHIRSRSCDGIPGEALPKKNLVSRWFCETQHAALSMLAIP